MNSTAAWTYIHLYTHVENSTRRLTNYISQRRINDSAKVNTHAGSPPYIYIFARAVYNNNMCFCRKFAFCILFVRGAEKERER